MTSEIEKFEGKMLLKFWKEVDMNKITINFSKQAPLAIISKRIIRLSIDKGIEMARKEFFDIWDKYNNKELDDEQFIKKVIDIYKQQLGETK